jgi:hypothetical protein
MTAGSIEGPGASYSLQDAAVLLGVSINTLRKRIRAGQVQAERVQRPQGYVWQVYVETLQPPDSPGSDPPSQEAPSRLQQPPQALMQAEAMAAYTRSLLEPLVATIERQADQLVSQAETIGSLRADLAVARAAISSLEARIAPQTVEPTSELPDRPLRFWQPWWMIMGAIAVAIVLAVALLAWPR